MKNKIRMGFATAFTVFTLVIMPVQAGGTTTKQTLRGTEIGQTGVERASGGTSDEALKKTNLKRGSVTKIAVVKQVAGNSMVATPKILVYEDYVVGSSAYQAALGSLGYGYTFTNDPNQFSALLSQNWDIVISANQDWDHMGTFQNSLINFVATHPTSGVLITDWYSSSAATYFPNFGFSWSTPTNSPNVIPEPSGFLSGLGTASTRNPGWIIWAYSVGGGTVLARNSSGIPCMALNNNVIVNGFLSDTFSSSVGIDIIKKQLDHFLMTDCNNNDIADATDITNGTSQDCNGNGIPDSCDIADGGSSVSPYPGAVQWTIASGGNGHWYARIQSPLTWDHARTACEALGGYLITITSEAENSFGSMVDQSNGCFIGGSQPADACEPDCNWQWVTGEQWNYTNWQDGEPNEYNPTEDCAQYLGGQWNDVSKDYARSYICEWETRSFDCNSNGIPDPCDIATGNSRDMNGNGKPDECEPNPVLTLTTNAAACNRVGSAIHVDATLSGVISPIVAGQVYLTWNSSKMTLDSISAGDAPFIEFHVINQTAGTALILVSLEQGGSAVSVSSKVVARLRYTVAGGSCDGSGTDIQFFPDGTLPTEFTDGFGGTMVPALVASSGFTVDDGAPVLSNVPPSVTVQAEAGMGSYANVALTPPTATDACSPLTQTAVRSDGASFGAAFPVGTTTVTWSATDPCANTTTATTLVTVNNANTATFAVSYSGGYPASSSRNFALDIHGDNGNNARSTSAMFAAGTASFSITDLAIATYDCVSIRDIGHSLRRRVAMSVVGTDWSATATLIAGDLNGNDVIDVVDWGMYIVGNSNADLDGNGVINSYDGAIIITNFGKQSDAVCGGALMGPPDPISAISVAELVDRGLTDLIGADLNNDGWLDMEDVRIAN